MALPSTERAVMKTRINQDLINLEKVVLEDRTTLTY